MPKAEATQVDDSQNAAVDDSLDFLHPNGVNPDAGQEDSGDDVADEHPQSDEPEGGEEPESADDAWQGEAALWGQELGLTPEEMQSFGSSEQFTSVAEKMYQALGRQVKPTEKPQSNGYEKPQPDQPQQQPYHSPPDLNLDELDEPVAKAIQTMQSRYDQLVDVLSNMNELLTHQGKSDEVIQAANEWDTRFDRLNNEAIFGKGSSLSGALAEEQRQRRWLVAQAVRAEREVMEQRGDVLPPIDIHTFRKARQLFGTLARGAIQKAAEESKRVAAHATPSGRSTSKKTHDMPQTDDQILAAWRKRHNIQ
uniref:Uncharacterized protein n=2 Tax=viral metagenome TaxID=1070528 RepID=A0A6M3KUW0_9ZZZZ